MPSHALLPVTGDFGEVSSCSREVLSTDRNMMDFEVGSFGSNKACCHKRRRLMAESIFSLREISRDFSSSLPVLSLFDYYMEPSLKDLAAREVLDPGYINRVPDFLVGRSGYGYVRFVGETDVRGLDLDRIVRFNRHELVVYEDEELKPEVGQGLNKAAEVTLVLQKRMLGLKDGQLGEIVKKLKASMERQGARFISFDPSNGEWKFAVDHFSRFGLSEDEDEDIMMDDATPVQDPVEMNGGEVSDVDEDAYMDPVEPELSHSLPAHLGLDPVKMKEMRMLMFQDEEDIDDYNGIPLRHKSSLGKEHVKSPLHNSAQKINHRSSPPVVRKTPLALLEYHPQTSDSENHGILMAQQNKDMPLKKLKADGFQLDLKHETPVTGSHSRNIVDAGLFMGRSFRVGWGPNGVLVHSGTAIGTSGSQRVMSSVINLEKVAIDKVVRDENNKVKTDLVKFSFDAPLNLHKELNHETEEVEVGSFKLKLQKVVSNRISLPEICRNYIDIIEEKLDVPGISASARLVLMHQVMVWELIKVLFSERESSGQSKFLGVDIEEDMMQDLKEGPPEVDQEALPLIRKAEFSCWLQESVYHRVQEEVSSLDESNHLKHLFLLLTGRQLDHSVELAASKGDVRLACLLSQAGGSMMNRSDVARQLNLWRNNGLDFNFIEKERVRLYELLAGNIHSSLHDLTIDWKRFLGLLMWYQLPPDTSLPAVFLTYQHLLNSGKAPLPVAIYIDEGPVEEAMTSMITREPFDLSYYLVLLFANGDREFSFLKTMFSSFSSTYDPLDYHMIWHQREILESVGAFSSNDLQVLDMGLVSQLLSQGQCHWAIYVALHMPHRDDYPYLQATLIREILFQYCETWSSEESQHQFIEEMGVPSEWLHEAMAVYHNYYRDLPKALEHFLECANWQKAHVIFVTSVAHSLFLSGDHEELWKLAASMENQKSEIENWDLGAGIYLSFYLIRSSLEEDNNTMSELDSLASKNDACKDFLGRLNESLAVWGSRLPLEARVAYSKMAEQINDLLLAGISEGPSRDAQLTCFDTVFSAPIPEDLRANHLHDAVSLFTCYLSEIAS